MNWLSSNRRRLILDMMLTGKDPEILSEIDVVQIATTIESAGIEVVTLWFKDENGFSLYPTKRGIIHPRLNGYDFAGELLNQLRKRSIRVVAYYCVGLDTTYALMNPDTQVVYNDNQPGFVSMPCLNTTYREYVLSQLSEIAAQYSINGFWLDCIWFPQKDYFPDPLAENRTKTGAISCYCRVCEQKFRSETGFDLPRDWKNNDLVWREWIKFKQKVLENFLKDARRIIKSINEDIAITHNMTAFNQHDSRVGLSWRTAKYDDWISAESYYPWTGHLGTSIIPRLLKKTNPGKPFEVAILSHGELWDWSLKPFDQLLAEAMTIMANGGAVAIDDHITPYGQLKPVVYERIRLIFDRIKAFEEFCDSGETLKYAAVVYSEKTRDLYAKGDARRYQSSFDGACRALVEGKIAFDVLMSENVSLEQLLKYRVVILPNTACIDDSTCKCISEAIKRGVGVIASGETALYDEDGNRRSDFGIGELGVHLLHDQLEARHVFLEFGVEDHDLLSGVPRRLPLNIKKPYTNVEGEGRAIGSLRLPLTGACNHYYRYYENPPGRLTGRAAFGVAPLRTGDVWCTFLAM